MREVEVSRKFQRDLKRMKKQGADMGLLVELIEKLRLGEPIPTRHHDHALSGNLSGFRDLHVRSDWILIYELSDTTVYLARTGSHSEILG